MPLADDRLTHLGDQLYEGQTKLTYYLMTANASATALSLSRAEAAPTDRSVILLVLPLAGFAGSRSILSFNGILHTSTQV